ncbi:MAG: choice-of-anchor Q domain-containing protein [Microbacteriaceae bacterium]
MEIRKSAALATTGGLVASAFGLVASAPAFAATCDGVTPIPATEAALRTALDNLEPVICIESGTIDFSSGGVDGVADSIGLHHSASIIGLGEVTMTSHGETGIFSATLSGIDLTIDNVTFDDATDRNDDAVIWYESSGTLTVSNCVFTNNQSARSAITIMSESAHPFITNTRFEGNTSTSQDGGAIYSYGGLDVSDSIFIDNFSPSVGGAIATEWGVSVSGSTFEGNHADFSGGALFVGDDSVIVNNTFAGNTSATIGGAARIGVSSEVLFNTFVGNSADVDANALNTLDFTAAGNIFADGPGLEIQNNGRAVTDNGANVAISTEPGDVQSLNSPSSKTGVSLDSLELGEIGDNGGTTETIALGGGSLARDLWTPALADAATSDNIPTLDQRGETRGASFDAGAWDDGETPSDLASTGVNAQGIALTGAALTVAGIASAARRRRKA